MSSAAPTRVRLKEQPRGDRLPCCPSLSLAAPLLPSPVLFRIAEPIVAFPLSGQRQLARPCGTFSLGLESSDMRSDTVRFIGRPVCPRSKRDWATPARQQDFSVAGLGRVFKMGDQRGRSVRALLAH